MASLNIVACKADRRAYLSLKCFIDTLNVSIKHLASGRKLVGVIPNNEQHTIVFPTFVRRSHQTKNFFVWWLRLTNVGKTIVCCSLFGILV